MKNLKKMHILIIFNIVIVTVIASGILYYFNSPVKYNYFYEGLVPASNIASKAIDEKFLNNPCYFNTIDEWNNFAKEYFEEGEISNLKDTKGPFIVIITNIYKDKKSSLIEISKIKRNLTSFRIDLRKKGEIKLVTGFDEYENVKSVLVYQIKSHLIGSDFIKDIKVY